jgi:hypothetical protein
MLRISESPLFTDSVDKDDLVEIMMRMQTMSAKDRMAALLQYANDHRDTRDGKLLLAELGGQVALEYSSIEKAA